MSLSRGAFPREKPVYYDNGQTYRSIHMRQIVATLGIHRIIFTKKKRPMGHGKIEKLNEYIRSAFLAELKVSGITTLDQLNEAFLAWADYEYNQRIHGETKQKPVDRWRSAIDRIRYADEEKLRQAFLWREKRTPDKAGIFGVCGTQYQVGPELAKKRIEVRYDPEVLDTVEIYHKGSFAQRLSPFEVQSHRRPKPAIEPQKPADHPPAANWLGHLMKKRQQQFLHEPSPLELAIAAKTKREKQNHQLVELLERLVEPHVFDEHTIRTYLERFGPFDSERAELLLQQLLEDGTRNDHHVHFYLELIRNHQFGEMT